MHNQPLTQRCVYCYVFVPRALLLLIVCCVLPCAVSTAVLCQGHCCSIYCMLCTDACFVSWALLLHVLHGYFLQMSYLSAPLLYMVIDNGAVYDCTDVISLIYILIMISCMLTPLRHCNFSLSVIMTVTL